VIDAALVYIEDEVARRPYIVGSELRDEFAGLYRAKRLDYRITYAIDERSKLITIVNITHRSNTYYSGR
jgi:mRNA-degrading endonuclease RelE of RelBE toxin-antitoxin system